MKVTVLSTIGQDIYIGVDAKGQPLDTNGQDITAHICSKPVWRRVIDGYPMLKVVMTHMSAEEEMTIVRQIAFIEDCEDN